MRIKEFPQKLFDSTDIKRPSSKAGSQWSALAQTSKRQHYATSLAERRGREEKGKEEENLIELIMHIKFNSVL